jgi:hypothetical protein
MAFFMRASIKKSNASELSKFAPVNYRTQKSNHWNKFDLTKQVKSNPLPIVRKFKLR